MIGFRIHVGIHFFSINMQTLDLPLFDPLELPPTAALLDEDELLILEDDVALEELDEPDLLLRRKRPEK